MTEHWTSEEHGDRLRIWADTPVRHGVADICIQRSITETGPSKTEKERAALIAAAPETTAERDRLREINAELLEALKELSAGMWAGDGITNPAVPGEQVAKARAAIAKAEAQ